MFIRLHSMTVLAMSALIICGQTLAQTTEKKKYPKNLFAVTPMHFDAVRAPHGLGFYTQTREADVILGSIAAALGISPVYVALAKAVPSGYSEGEATHYTIPVEAGYAYCGTRLRVTSIVPASGDRASYIAAAVKPTGLQMTTWTPRRHSWEGRSWAEGDIQVFGIRPEYLEEFTREGVCKTIARPSDGFFCRGQHQCSSGWTHGDPLEVKVTAPDLKEGW